MSAIGTEHGVCRAVDLQAPAEVVPRSLARPPNPLDSCFLLCSFSWHIQVSAMSGDPHVLSTSELCRDLRLGPQTHICTLSPLAFGRLKEAQVQSTSTALTIALDHM